MSISSKLLFPVAHSASSRETGNCYSAIFKKLFPLSFIEGQLGQKFLVFLYLNINYVLFDETLS